jgi:hypothetical protein
MREEGLSLQLAVNKLTAMITQRMHDYVNLKANLPSFGKVVDDQVTRYLAELEHEAYGSIRWYYESPSAGFIGSCNNNSDEE